MKFLLDTHIWLWNSLQPNRLSPRVARQLDNPGNELWLSPVSLWELRLLYDKGRVRLVPDAVNWINESLVRTSIRGRR